MGELSLFDFLEPVKPEAPKKASRKMSRREDAVTEPPQPHPQAEWDRLSAALRTLTERPEEFLSWLARLAAEGAEFGRISERCPVTAFLNERLPLGRDRTFWAARDGLHIRSYAGHTVVCETPAWILEYFDTWERMEPIGRHRVWLPAKVYYVTVTGRAPVTGKPKRR